MESEKVYLIYEVEDNPYNKSCLIVDDKVEKK